MAKIIPFKTRVQRQATQKLQTTWDILVDMEDFLIEYQDIRQLKGVLTLVSYELDRLEEILTDNNEPHNPNGDDAA